MTTRAGWFVSMLPLIPMLGMVIATHAAVAQGTPRRWGIAASAGIAAFSGAASADGVAGATRLVPAAAAQAGLALIRSGGGLELETGLELLTTVLGVRDADVSVEARDASLTRLRWRLAVGIPVLRLGEARVAAIAGPALELWSPRGADARMRAAGAARIELELDAGPFALRNALGMALSASPLRAAELPPDYRRTLLRTVEAAVGVRFGRARARWAQAATPAPQRSQ